jgi:hypothetical protein
MRPNSDPWNGRRGPHKSTDSHPCRLAQPTTYRVRRWLVRLTGSKKFPGGRTAQIARRFCDLGPSPSKRPHGTGAKAIGASLHGTGDANFTLRSARKLERARLALRVAAASLEPIGAWNERRPKGLAFLEPASCNCGAVGTEDPDRPRPEDVRIPWSRTTSVDDSDVRPRLPQRCGFPGTGRAGGRGDGNYQYREDETPTGHGQTSHGRAA